MNDCRMIEIVPLPAFKDNYIWLLRAGGHVDAHLAQVRHQVRHQVRQTMVVDPGDAAPVLDYLKSSGDRLCAILLTHHHADHIGGVPEILARHPVPVFGPAAENIASVSHPLSGGERIVVPELGAEFEIINIPGHTRGHIAYYGAGFDALFCGDTLFGAGCGRLFEGTPAQMQASLASLAALPGATRIYCGHEYTASNLRFALAVEPDNVAIQRRIQAVAVVRADGRPSLPSRIDIELETNPFLRWEAASVRAAAAGRLGRPPTDAIETFAVIREWKNQF